MPFTNGDYHGVQVWAWLNGKYLGTKYNGGGVNSTVIWDPYSIFPSNVAKDEGIGLEICLVDGGSNRIESSCAKDTQVSKDG